jgi:hypothetical protein
LFDSSLVQDIPVPFAEELCGERLLCMLVESEKMTQPVAEKFPHYYKSVKGLDHVDVYRVLSLFNVTDPCLQHALKKLLVAGGRTAGKDIRQDVQEAMDSLVRWQAMRAEDVARIPVQPQAVPSMPLPLPSAWPKA